jgi:rubrerythrin
MKPIIKFSPIEIYKYMNDDYYEKHIKVTNTGFCPDGSPYPMNKLTCTLCGTEWMDDEEPCECTLDNDNNE